MTDILLLFAAPVIQIVLSVLRIMGRTTMPLGAIAVLSFVLGVILSIFSMNLIEQRFSGVQCTDCGMVWMSALITGFFIALVSTPIIGLIGYAIYRLKNHPDAAGVKEG